MQKRTFQIYRYDPDKDAKPYMQTVEIELEGNERMLLDALMKLKAIDPTCVPPLLPRGRVRLRRDEHQRQERPGLPDQHAHAQGHRSCLKPLPGLPVIRDLIVDMTQFFKQYHSIKPYLVNDSIRPRRSACSRRRSATSSTACTSASCARAARPAAPASGGTPTSSSVPAGLLQAYRFIADSRDQATAERLDNLEDPYRLFRCHTIMNCVDVCPKGLNPTMAIGKIKELMVRRAV